jgi:hypothetical protein
MSPYYFVDIKDKEGKYNMTFDMAYVDTPINDNGDYVLNLGKLGEVDITMMVEDQAGNRVVSSTLNNTDDIKFENKCDVFNGIRDVLVDGLSKELLKTGDKKIFSKTLISRDMLDEGGNYNVTCILDEKYTKLVVNGINAEFDTTTKEYKVSVPLLMGKNNIKVQHYTNNDVTTTYEVIYLDDIEIKLSDVSDGMIEDADTIVVSGSIKSYIPISKIRVNGNCVYTSKITGVSDNYEPIDHNFNYEVTLQSGINNIKIEVENMVGHKDSKVYKVEKK